MSRGTAKEPHGCQRNFTLIIVLLVVICGRRSNSCILHCVHNRLNIILVEFNTFTGNNTEPSKIFMFLLLNHVMKQCLKLQNDAHVKDRILQIIIIWLQ